MEKMFKTNVEWALCGESINRVRMKGSHLKNSLTYILGGKKINKTKNDQD